MAVRKKMTYRNNERRSSFCIVLRFTTLIALSICSYLCTASASFALPTSVEYSGNTISYLGKSYNLLLNITRFEYRIDRSSTDTAISSIQFPIPDELSDVQLVNVDSDLPHRFSFDSDSEAEQISFSLLSSSEPQTTIELSFLGNVPEGESKVAVNGGDPEKIANFSIAGPPIIEQGDGVLPKCESYGVSGSEVNADEAINFSIIPEHMTDKVLKFRYQDLPEGMTVDTPSGSDVSAYNPIEVNWTPSIDQVNSNYEMVFDVLDQEGETSQCLVNLFVSQNNPPVVAMQAVPNPYECQGTITKIFLDASASYDPEGAELTYTWEQNCPNSKLENHQTSTPVLSLYNPGKGISTQCEVSLTVSDGEKTSFASAVINVPGCELTCDPSEKDVCGVCGGHDACLDCKGVPFGDDRIDRCGVCGGTNDCVDCKGLAYGDSQKDLCNVCDGDGRSCQNCERTNFTGVQRTLDSSSADQAKIVNLILRRIPKAQAKRTKTRVEKLRIRNWGLAWSLDQQTFQCFHYLNCSQNMHAQKLIEYSKNARQLKQLAYRATNIWKNNTTVNSNQVTRFSRRLLRRANRTFRKAVGSANTYPASTIQCPTN